MNSFHIYAFILISGYIYAYLRYEKNKYSNFNLFLKKKFKRLIVPYIFTSTFWVIPFYIYYFNGDLEKVMLKYFLGILPSQLWFLLMLFNIFIIAFFIEKLIYSFYIKGMFTSLLIYIFGIIFGKIFPNVYQISSSCRAFIYFSLGMMLYKGGVYFIEKIPSYIYILVFTILQLLKYNLSLILPNSYI